MYILVHLKLSFPKPHGWASLSLELNRIHHNTKGLSQETKSLFFFSSKLFVWQTDCSCELTLEVCCFTKRCYYSLFFFFYKIELSNLVWFCVFPPAPPRAQIPSMGAERISPCTGSYGQPFSSWLLAQGPVEVPTCGYFLPGVLSSFLPKKTHLMFQSNFPFGYISGRYLQPLGQGERRSRGDLALDLLYDCDFLSQKVTSLLWLLKMWMCWFEVT